MANLGIKMRSGAYASSRQDTHFTGGAGGGQEFMGAVDYTKSGCPDTDVCTGHLGRCPMCKVLRAVDGSFVSYKDI
jgi:hypothetical protein